MQRLVGPMTDDRIKVLVADDDELFVESLRELIGRQPELEVVGEAHNGLEAIDLTDELDPDAVVVDLHMPLLDGVTAVARLRRDHPNLCLIVVTGDADAQLHRAASEAGADAVLEKSELAQRLIDRLSAESARRPSSA
jgi:DNA-binding NarL/FixJ family response regulator